MTAEIGQEITVASPTTGELLTLDSPTSDLGRFLADVREHESMMREAKNLVQREIVRRMDFNAKYTEHIGGGLKLTAPSPKPEEHWDGAELHQALLGFVDRGILSVQAVDTAVEQVITFKPSKRGINSLRALGGEIAETIESLKSTVEKDRRVTVSRA